MKDKHYSIHEEMTYSRNAKKKKRDDERRKAREAKRQQIREEETDSEEEWFQSPQGDNLDVLRLNRIKINS